VNALVEWFDRQAARERRTPCLEDAFARDCFLPYAFYRLRFFLARAGWNWALHAVGVWLVFGSLSRRQFGVVALAHFGAAFVSSAWWGCLEEMRTRVRELYRAGRMHLIPREVAAMGFLEACLLCIILRLALEIPWRCYHSGLYAVRRIYRPLPAMVTVDVLGFLALLVLWPLLGRWSIPASSLFSSLLITSVGVYYASRSYRFLGLDPFQCIARRRGLGLSRESLQRLIAAGSAGGIMTLDALLVVVAVTTAAWHGTSAALFVPLFLISPAVRAGYDWAQLFYFDLKRLEAVPFGDSARWLGDRVFALSWFIGPLFWAGAWATAAWSGSPLGSLGLPLLSFFHSRSLLAALQVRNFVEAAYGKLIGTGFVLLAGYLAAGFALAPGGALLGLAAVNYLAVLGLVARNSASVRWPGYHKPLLPTVWLQALAGIHGPVQVWAIRCCTLDTTHSRVQSRELAQTKARRLTRPIARKLGSR